ncbi:MAG: hypothetical protein KC431_02405 [Myxococcales bacterium]|nr:hypothetical protein [Myxococcales bacterium]
MRMPKHPNFAAPLALAALLLALPACGDEEGSQTTSARGMPAGTTPMGAGAGGDAGKGSRRSGSPNSAGGEPDAEAERPDRPRPVLTRDDFSLRSRDPFHNYAAATAVAAEPVPVEVVRKQRDVKLSEYGFEQLRLIAIVNAGRGVPPTALFLASSDNKSKSVKQGEYFSSAELLLASVNRDYIEIEVVDPELSPGWNLDRGERKVIYLKDR